MAAPFVLTTNSKYAPVTFTFPLVRFGRGLMVWNYTGYCIEASIGRETHCVYLFAHLILLLRNRLHLSPLGVWILDFILILMGNWERMVIFLVWVAFVIVAGLRVQSQAVKCRRKTHTFEVALPVLVVAAIVPAPLGNGLYKAKLA
jgi:hypothetical protein